VALQSWALWTARGLGLPYTPYAVDGARVDDVVDHQIPLFLRVNADPAARYALGCLYIGTNDSRHPDWDPVRFEQRLDEAFGFLVARCARVLTATLPRAMGRPPNPAAISTANAVITSVAARHGVLVLDLADFGARNLIMFDHVHPTAFGQVAIAERALARLAADGMEVRISPSALLFPNQSWFGALYGDLLYSFRCARCRLSEWCATRR
jgi:hypothetical protein